MDDVKPGWVNVVRHAQARCKDNNGYAVVKLVVLVNGNDPLMWFEADVSKIHPSSATKIKFSPTLAGALATLAAANGKNPDEA